MGTKAGQIFVLDRANGQPLTKVEEVAMKPGTIDGEQYPATQPLSVGMPQIGTQKLTEADMWGATPFDQLICRIKFKSMRYDGLFTVPGTDTSLSFPGSLGGMNWGGISADPTNNLIFVNDMRLGLWVKMVPQQRRTSCLTAVKHRTRVWAKCHWAAHRMRWSKTASCRPWVCLAKSLHLAP